MFVDQRSRINEGVISHLTSLPPPGDQGKSCDTEINCVNPGSFPGLNYDKVAPVTQASFTRRRIANTELFGGAFRGQDGGDGLRHNTDAWNSIWTPPDGFSDECDRCISETNYNRFHCIDGLPLTWEGSWVYGSDTRQGAQTFTKCDY
jgi:hypothetical protein